MAMRPSKWAGQERHGIGWLLLDSGSRRIIPGHGSRLLKEKLWTTVLPSIEGDQTASGNWLLNVQS
jgi:hypothetical protein